jgi:hypothetical protein
MRTIPPDSLVDAVERRPCASDQIVRVAGLLVAEGEGVDPEQFDIGEEQDSGHQD